MSVGYQVFYGVTGISSLDQQINWRSELEKTWEELIIGFEDAHMLQPHSSFNAPIGTINLPGYTRVVLRTCAETGVALCLATTEIKF